MIISIPDKITSENSEKYTMSIRLQPGGLSFSLYDPHEVNNYFYQEVFFERLKDYTDALKEFFFEHDFMAWSYKQVNVICVGALYTVVPEEFFKEKEQHRILALNHEKNSDKILNNHLKGDNGRLIFDMDEPLYEFICRSVIKPDFYHHLTLLIACWQRQSAVDLCQRMEVFLRKKAVDILCFSKGNLLFANSFTYEHVNDLMYYILFVWQTNGMDQLRDKLFMTGETEVRNRLTTLLQVYLNNIAPMEIPSEAYLIGGDILQAPLDLISLSVCEL